MHRPSFSLAVIVTAAALLTPTLAHAQILTPGVDEPFNGGLSSPSREVPRVLQSFIDNSFLTSVTSPTTLTGLSFRLPGVANVAYPDADLTFPRYDITLAKPSQAAIDANALVSDTFADNMQSPLLVRSGPLTIPAGALTDNSTGPGPEGAAEFSFFIPFTTPYTLQPGDDLVVLIRHNGYGTPQQTNWNFDAFTYTSGGRVATGNVDAASGALIPDTVIKYAFQIQPPPTLVGDTNDDGVVDLVDLNNVLNNFGATGTSPGDDNNDGVVDLTDLNNVLNNFGNTAPPASALSTIPEPASASLLTLATLPLLTRRPRPRA